MVDAAVALQLAGGNPLAGGRCHVGVAKTGRRGGDGSRSASSCRRLGGHAPAPVPDDGAARRIGSGRNDGQVDSGSQFVIATRVSGNVLWLAAIERSRRRAEGRRVAPRSIGLRWASVPCRSATRVRGRCAGRRAAWQLSGARPSAHLVRISLPSRVRRSRYRSPWCSMRTSRARPNSCSLVTVRTAPADSSAGIDSSCLSFIAGAQIDRGGSRRGRRGGCRTSAPAALAQ